MVADRANREGIVKKIEPAVGKGRGSELVGFMGGAGALPASEREQ